MPKAAVFTMKLEPDLRAEFMAAAEASHRPASQVVRQSMRGFVQREQDRCDHGAFLQRKVEAARVPFMKGRAAPMRWWRPSSPLTVPVSPTGREGYMDASSRAGSPGDLGLP